MALTHLKSDIDDLLSDYKQSLELISNLSEVGELLFFGGLVRDYYLSDEKFEQMPRDFDIAIKVNEMDHFRLEEVIREYDYIRNRFSGYKIEVDNLTFDVWRLENTWAFKEKKLLAKEENLVKSVYLSTDGIVYNYNRDIYYDDGLRESITNEKIDIVLKENPQRELNLLRALVYSKKYELGFSKRLKSEYCRLMNEEERAYIGLYNEQINHYGEELLTKNEISKKLDEINKSYCF